MLILKFIRIASFIVLAKFKQVFIKIYINKDGICSGQTSGNIQVTDSYTGVGGVYMDTAHGPLYFHVKLFFFFFRTTTPRIPESYLVLRQVGFTG